MSKTNHCPGCRSGDVTRSRTRNLVERVLKYVFRTVPYRCVDCGRRFFRQQVALPDRITG